MRVATPLLLAALGETIAERGGVINLGIEGAMLAGALAAAIGSRPRGRGPVRRSHWYRRSGRGMFALIAVKARADQIITGTAIAGSVGLTGAIYRRAYGPAGVGLTLPTFPVLPIPGLSQIPLWPALFAQSILTYTGYCGAGVMVGSVPNPMGTGAAGRRRIGAG